MPYFTHGDVPLYYKVQGSKDQSANNQGLPLVFIHGLGSSAEDWSYQVAHYCAKWRVIVIDCRLHGKSGGESSPFSLPLCAADINALLEYLGCPEAIVVGVSMGGMIGFELAAAYPARVKALVAVNALAECKARLMGEKWMLWSRTLLLRLAPIKTIATLMAKQLLPGSQFTLLREEVIKRWQTNTKENYFRAFEALVGWQLSSPLSGIHCPVLLVASEFDYTPVGSKKVLASVLANGECVVLDNTHHLAPLENPVSFNRVLDLWLAGHEPVG